MAVMTVSVKNFKLFQNGKYSFTARVPKSSISDLSFLNDPILRFFKTKLSPFPIAEMIFLLLLPKTKIKQISLFYRRDGSHQDHIMVMSMLSKECWAYYELGKMKKTFTEDTSRSWLRVEDSGWVGASVELGRGEREVDPRRAHQSTP